MYKLVFSKQSQAELDIFINSILEKNLKIFEDCGIDNVAFIEESYLSHSQSLRKKILSCIVERASSDIIGSSQISGDTCFILQIASFRLFVYYSEDSTQNIRYIQRIEFYRK